MSEDTTPPHDMAAEVSALGAMILAPDRIPDVRGIVRSADFYRPAHQTIFDAVLSMHANGTPIDLVLLRDAMERQGTLASVGGIEYLAGVVDGVPSVANVEYYAGIVRDHSIRRQYLTKLGKLRTMADGCSPGTNAGEMIGEALRELAGLADAASSPTRPGFRTIRELVAECPGLRPPVINGLLREGESMNVVAPTKKCKSWMVGDLALALATGGLWFGRFRAERRAVLILDNELHRETTAYRIPEIAKVRGIPIEDYGDALTVDNVRGRGLTIDALPAYFANVERGRFGVVILDALYRFWPPDTSENDNAAAASFYNKIDALAARQKCAFVLVHHTAKGSQGGKALTDVGAGAGAIARAADTHLILVAHKTDTVKFPAVVLDAGARSWGPIEPFCLRFKWPVWEPAEDLDPAAVKSDWGKSGRGRKVQPKEEAPAKPIPDATADFVAKYITKDPQARAAIIDAAKMDGLSENRAKKLLAAAEARKLAFLWPTGPRKPDRFADVAPPTLDAGEGR